MDTARYFAALSVLIIIPTAFVLWAPIHGFSAFWRQFGFFGTYGILSIPAGGATAVIVIFRDMLLQIDFGGNSGTAGLSLLCWISMIGISTQCRQHLTFSILAGVPELAPRNYPGKLLTEGIYASIRHPRYVSVILWLFGCVLFANYLMPYMVFIMGIPGMYLLVWLEERELRQRFGVRYDAYCREVPRFVPRLRRKA